MPTITVETSHGPARASVLTTEPSRGLLILGPGASGKSDAADLITVAEAVHDAGLSVALVTPPYAVAGRKVPPRGPAPDEAWVQVVEALRTDFGGPVVTGGRSFGSRVACRTAAATGSLGVLCLAFPLHPPGKPEQSRLGDLEAASVPTLVVQGRSDPFGMPPTAESRTVFAVDGNHSLAKDHPLIVGAVVAWLNELLGSSYG